MNRPTAILLLSLLLTAAPAAARGPAEQPSWPDSLRTVWYYTEGLREELVTGDTVRARTLLHEALRIDSTYAPAYYALAASLLAAAPEQAVEPARKAHELDSTNLWYHRFYGETLLQTERYGEALRVYRRLLEREPDDPDHYRIVAALYEQRKSPVMALVTLDSAELRFGRIPLLSDMKRQLLVATNQLDRAVAEAQAQVEAAPYEARHHAVLADLYARTRRDSLARAEYDRALAIDSTDVQTLLALADYHAERRDYRALLGVTRRLFLADEVPLELKIKRFERFTSDTRFYRENYYPLNDLVATLAIRYPDDRRVAELYARHRIASGELEQALALYKSHLDAVPPPKEFYRSVIDIESYLQRSDSVELYVARALEQFPEEVEFHLAKGHVAAYAKHYDRAIEAYRASLRRAGTDSLRSAVWGLIGDVWHQKALSALGRHPEEAPVPRPSAYRKAMKECYKAYDRSLSLDPDNAAVLNNSAYFLALEGRDLEQALERATRAVERTDNNPTYLDTRAWVLFRLGRAAEAKKVQQKAVALDGGRSPELMVHYGDILDALGERFLAEVYWRQALEKGYDSEAIARRFGAPAAAQPEKP